MSSEWPLARLGDHVDACLGKMLDAKKNKGTPQPYLGNSNVRWGEFDLVDLAEMRFEAIEEERYSLRPGDLVICEGGEPGRCAIWSGPTGMKIQKALHRIRSMETLDNHYLLYWFRHAAKTGYLDAHFTGTTIKHLTGRAIAALEVSLPPVATQRAMAYGLKSLDDRIALLRETNSTLEAIAQALFKSWFVEFDPVRAKQQGLAPAGMDEAMAALFPDSFEASMLGLMPKGWRHGVLGEVVRTIKSQLHPSELHAAMNYVGLEHLPRKSLSLVDWETADGLESAKAKFSKGDVLFGKLRPYFHKVVVAPFDGVCSTDILVCQSKHRAYYCFAAMQLFSAELIAYADRLSNGAKMPRIGWNDIAAYPLIVPTEQIAAAYTEVVSPLLDRMNGNVFQAQTLATLRDTLLPRLISGQLRMPEVVAEANEAMA